MLQNLVFCFRMWNTSLLILSCFLCLFLDIVANFVKVTFCPKNCANSLLNTLNIMHKIDINYTFNNFSAIYACRIYLILLLIFLCVLFRKKTMYRNQTSLHAQDFFFQEWYFYFSSEQRKGIPSTFLFHPLRGKVKCRSEGSSKSLSIFSKIKFG